MNFHSNESQKLKRRLKIFSSLFVAIILGIFLSTNYFKLSLPKPSLPSSVVGVETTTKAEIISSLEAKTKELKLKRAEHKRTKAKATADEIKLIAKERKNLLLETARFNSDAALSQILSQEERVDPDLKTITENDIEQDAIIEGELEVFHGDNFEKKNSQTDYSLLTSKGEKFSLRVARGLRTNLFSAKKIKVKGFKIDNELLFDGMGDISAPEKVESAGGFQILQEAAALSKAKVVILLANFQNTTQPAVTPEEVKGMLNQVDNYYQENSYGRVGISGDVFGWYNIQMNQVCVPNDSALSLAMQAAQQQDKVNFSQYSMVAVYAPFGSPTGCQWSGYAKWNGTRRIWVSYVNLHLLAHEIGHQFGVGHAKFYDCGTVPIGGSSCKTYEYGDPHDVMGSGDGHFNAIHKVQKKWLDSSDIQYVAKNGLYTIKPIETDTDGFEIIKVGDYIIEYRQPIGFDKNLGGWSNAFEGALFSIDSTLLLDANASPTDLAKNTQAALRLGETFFIPSTNITITPVSKTPEALTLDIRFDGTIPPPLIVADFIANPQIGQAPLTVQFTDKSTGNINAWQWDFNNDGTIDSNEQKPPAYTYRNQGSYAVSLIISSPAGAKTETKLNYINVEGPPPSGSISASPNPCTITQNQTTCSSTITWQTTNAPNACVFAKETKQLLACAASGNQTTTGITEQGTTFEVHLNNDINSQLLASVLVKGEKQIIPSFSLNISKFGTGNGTIIAPDINCGADCSETYNQGTSVALTVAPDGNSTFKNWSGDCSGTSSTCSLTMNSNKSAAAVFEKKIIITTVCSTGPLRACIDSISPNPAKIGETIMLKGHYESDDSNKVINKFRWRIDSTSDKGSFLGDGQSLLLNRSLPTGVHTIYFRVGTPRLGKILTQWSNWIAKDFTVETVTSVCGNNICESGETSDNCLADCPLPVKPQCSDTLDNDGDNKIDYPSDPGCTLATDNDEKDAPQTQPQCSDGLDNDNDNKIDYPQDLGCSSPVDNDEKDTPPPPSNIPAAPSNVKVVKNSSPTGYLITWQDNSNNETAFRISRKVESGEWYNRGYAGSNITRYIDISTNTLINTFRVSACNKESCSAYVESNPIDLY